MRFVIWASSVISVLMLQVYAAEEEEKPDADFIYLLKSKKEIRRFNIVCNNGTHSINSTDSHVDNVSTCVRGKACFCSLVP